MLISSLALFKSSIAAFRFSLLRAMLFGIRNPVNKGMLVLSEKLVFLVLRSPYVLSACKARPKLNDCPTLPFRLGRRLYLAVFKSTAF